MVSNICLIIGDNTSGKTRYLVDQVNLSKGLNKKVVTKFIV